jgi:IS30 family transposase
VETRTSGAEGGPGKRTRKDPDTAPRPDPYITGAANRSAIGTLVERVSRFTILLHLPSGRHTAEDVRDALVAAMGQLPAGLRRSLTWDQGSELALHADVAQALGMPVFFCEPHSPWQRPSNENTNGLLRQYFPKGTDLRVHGPEQLVAVAVELNERPRKTLGWGTPADRLTTALQPGNDMQ